MYAFKFVTKEYGSPGGYGQIDYSGPWPKTIEELNYDPASEGQCAAGIHVIPLSPCANLSSVVLSHKAVIFSINQKDLIYREGLGKMRSKKATVIREATEADWEIIDQAVANNTRNVSLVKYINLTGRNNDYLRKAALSGPELAYSYARDIDKCPSDDTRTAACQDSYTALKYARDIDKRYRLETYKACSDECDKCHYKRSVPVRLFAWIKDLWKK